MLTEFLLIGMMIKRKVRDRKMDSLEKLVERACANDDAAFEELYQRYHQSVYKAAMKLCKNEADAQDVVQLTFLQVKKSLSTLEKPEYFPYWINRIALNKCKNLFRNNHADTYDNEYYKLFNQVVDKKRDRNSEKAMHFTSDQEVLLEMMNSLRPELREVLVLTYFEQLNNEESAALLNIPVGTIKSRLYTAKKLMKKKIQLYEKQEQVALDFQSDAFTGVAITGTALSLPKRIFQSVITGGGSMAAQIAAVITLCVGGILGGNAIYQAYKEHQNNQSTSTPKQALSSPQTHEQSQSESFSIIEVNEYQITNAKDAYFLLRGWAYDVSALETKTAQELKQMQPLYIELKKQGGPFYTVLEIEGWNQAFENLIKEI